MSSISKSIFNTEFLKTVNSQSLFLQEPLGLVDTIHRKHPRIWELYKMLKSLDWDEQEFDYRSCLDDFKTCPSYMSDLMIKTIAWQWEADSIASNNLLAIVSPFVTSTELMVAYAEVQRNESVHSLTYAEIVRNSFDHPDEVMASVLAEAQAIRRLEVVAEVLANTYRVSHQLALGMIDRDSDEAYDAIFLFVVAMFGLERIQFINSFAITFGIVNTSWFIPIGKAVQKINTDELHIHVQLGKAVLANELSTSVGQKAFIRNKDKIVKIISDITNSELAWNEYIFKDFDTASAMRDKLPFTKDSLDSFALFGTTDVFVTLGLDNPYRSVNVNPLPYMDDWTNINSNQASPQEERVANYLLGGFIDDTDGVIFSTDFDF
jgi:ribonucleoside-diphosphate reductase beta chain